MGMGVVYVYDTSYLVFVKLEIRYNNSLVRPNAHIWKHSPKSKPAYFASRIFQGFHSRWKLP